MSTFVPPPLAVPRDQENPDYILSFLTHEVDKYIEFFNEFGFVIIKDVLTNKECEDSIDDIWNYLEKGSWTHSVLQSPQIKRSDPKTWKNKDWPEMMEEGILGSPPVFTQQALKIRQNPNIYKVFSSLLGREDLIVNHDRYGLFRPTEGVNVDGKDVNFSQWKTFRNIHIDMNPWMHVEASNSEHSENILKQLRYKRHSDFITENNHVGCLIDNQLHLQGLINFSDNVEKDGGLHIIPGFNKNLVEWVIKNPHLKNRYGNRNTFIVLSEFDPLNKQTVRMTAKAGSLIVWDQRTIHGSDPNCSNRARYAQFLKYFPAQPMDEERRQARKESVSENLEEIKFNEENGLSDLGKKLFGQVDW